MNFSLGRFRAFFVSLLISTLAWGCGSESDPIIAPSIISVNPMMVDFGRVPVGSSVRKEIVVSNTGQRSLNVTRVRFLGDTNAFSLTQVPGAVAPQDKKSGILEFRPDVSGDYSAILIIESNADNNTAYQVEVRGTAVDSVMCGDCNSPPPSICVSEFDLRMYDLIGLCDSGECEYQERIIACPQGCENDRCLNYDVPTATVSISPNPAYTDQDLTVSATVSATSLETARLSYEWFKNGVLVSQETRAVLSSARTAKGETWKVVVTPSDGVLSGAKVSAWVQIKNSVPQVNSATISPSIIQELSGANCLALGGTDQDQDQISYAYVWTVNGTQAATGTILDGSSYNRGDSLQCIITPNDGEQDGPPFAPSPVIVQNTKPTISLVNIGPAAPNELSVVTATVSGWRDPDGDIPRYDYSWSVNGSTVSRASVINGSHFDRDDVIELEVTAFDGFGAGNTMRSNQIIAANTPPNIAGVTLFPSSPTTIDDISAFPVGWTDLDGDSESYTYEWFINSQAIIAGSNLTANRTRRDDQIYVRVTPYDGRVRGTSIVSSTITVVNSIASVSVVSIDPASGNETTTFTCVGSGWRDNDGDTPNYYYQWFINNGLSVTTSTIDGSYIRRGDRIRCEMTPYDGRNLGLTQSSGTLLITNTPPSISSVSINPSTGRTDTSFECIPSGWSDADNDPPNYNFQWTINGAPSVTTASIAANLYGRGDRVACTVTPNDLVDLGMPVASPVITIENSLPVITDAYLQPDPAYTNNDLQAFTVGWSDLDGDTPAYVYDWFVNGQHLMFALGDTLLGANFVRGDQVYVRVTPTDGTLGTPVETSTLTILNSVPTIFTANISPATGNETTTFTCTPGGWNDGDNDSPGYLYSWSVNSATVASGVSFLDGSLFDRGDQIYCTITPFDGRESGVSVSSSSVSISNTAPSIQGVSLSPPQGSEATVFRCLASAWLDPDGDGPAYDYEWYVNDSLVSSADQLSGSDFDRDQRVNCRIRPNDQQGGIGSWLASSTATIANSSPEAATATITPANPFDVEDLVCAILVESQDLDNDVINYRYRWTSGTKSHVGATLSSTMTVGGERWTCTVTPNDGLEDGTSSVATIGPLRTYCVTRDGSIPECAARDCFAIANDGYSTGDGLYWIDPLGTESAYQAHCLMDLQYDSGGWTLVAVSSDDGQDNWTWNNRNYWDSVQSEIGSISELNRDFKSRALHEVAGADLLFLHAPSGQWAAYNDVSISGAPLSDTMALSGTGLCYFDEQGLKMTSGSISVGGNLCSTDLYLSPRDQDGGLDCNCPTCLDHTYGPAWSARSGISCPHESPGLYGGLGPNAAEPQIEGGISSGGNPLGFGGALGLNTAVTGTGGNYLQVYVREVDRDRDGFARYEDCNDDNNSVFPRAGDAYGDGIDSDCDGLDCEAATDNQNYFTACPDNGYTKNEYEDLCRTANYDGLASIRSSSEQDFIDQLIDDAGINPSTQREAFYFGYNVSTGQSSDGSSSAYVNWYPSEPNGDGACAVTNWLLPGRWNDLACSWTNGGGICQLRNTPRLRFSRIYEAESALLHVVGRREGNAWSANTVDDDANNMAYGPYARDWPETVLTVTYRLMVDVVNNLPEQVVSIDVFDSTTSQILASRAINRNEFDEAFTYKDFELQVDVSGRRGNAFETRVFWNDASYVRLDYIFVSE